MMADHDGMAAGRTCLDCGGSATRDFAFACEHRFLEPERSVRVRVEAFTGRLLRGFEGPGPWPLESQVFVDGHGVTAWAPTREAAVALWRARVLDVGRALVELVPWLRSVTEAPTRAPSRALAPGSLWPKGLDPDLIAPVVGVDPAAEPSSSLVTFVTPGPRGERHQVPADSAAGVLARLLDIELAQNREDACEALAVLGRAVGAGITLGARLDDHLDDQFRPVRSCRVWVEGSPTSRTSVTASRALLELASDIDREIARRVDADLGITAGMQAGIDDAEGVGRPVEYRSLEGWAASPPDPTQACAERLACGVIQRCECEAEHRRFVTWPDPAAPGPHVHAWPRGGSRFEPDAVCTGPDCPRAEHNR